MLYSGSTYLQHLLRRTIPVPVLLLIFSMSGFSQTAPLPKDSLLARGLNEAFITANKSPVQVRVFYNVPPYKVYTVRKGRELMYWPNFPLTASQIAERDRKYDKPMGQQIAGEIAESLINNLIYGNKGPVVVRPRF